MADPTIVPLSGEYDLSRSDELDQLLDRYGDAEPLALDLQAVVAFDSSALRSLIRFQQARREAGKAPIVLLRPSPSLTHSISSARLDGSFEIRERL